jgi:integrase
MERAAIARKRWSENTRKAYAVDWRDFWAWCELHGLQALPASGDTLSLYAVSLARAGKLPSTIARRCAAVAAQHLGAGHASPLSADVREVIAGIGRKLGTESKLAKAALTVDDLRVMLPACGDGPRGARDRALLLVGFASGLRRSNLAALDLADVVQRPEGLVLHIARSKTDQAGAGRRLGVFRGKHRATCPVRAFAAWVLERGDWAGPLFCRLSKPGDAVIRKRLSGDAVAELVQAAAKRAGLDPRRYGGHSLRAGCATAAAEGGASDSAIMARTGHKSAAVMGRYIRSGSLFAIDALAGVL